MSDELYICTSKENGDKKTVDHSYVKHAIEGSVIDLDVAFQTLENGFRISSLFEIFEKHTSQN